MRERILQAAIEEIRIHGLRFTMSDLTKRLRVSKTSLYEYYASKNELVQAFATMIRDDLREQRENILQDSTLSIPEKIHALLKITPQDINPYTNQLYDDFLQYYPVESKPLDEFLQEQLDQMTTLLLQGIATNVIRPVNSKVFRQMVLGVVLDLLTNQFLKESNMTLRDALSDMADIIMLGLLPSKK